MNIKQFHCDTKIIMGEGTSATAIASNIKSQFPDVERIMVVSDKGLVRLGLVEPIISHLTEEGYTTVLFDEVSQNPRDTECMKGATLYRSEGIDLVLAIGGGSPIDTAKAIALLGPNGGTPLDYYHKKRIYENIAPIVCVPTTAGTGSEVTRSSDITISETHQKITLKDASLRPSLAILDPTLTYSLPASITAATGVDALVHAIEGYTCKVTNPISQAIGAEAMRLIVEYLPQAYRDDSNKEARMKMLEGSLLAGMCFGSADVAAVHCLAEGLGSLYDTPHGVANAIFLPHVIRFNAQEETEVHARLSRIMKFSKEGDSDLEAVEKLIVGIQDFTEKLGIPKLREIAGVNEKDFDRLVQLALENSSTASNVLEIKEEDYRDILNQAFSEEPRTVRH